MKFKVGSKVKWSWLGRVIYGRVEEIHLESVIKTIKGKKITRHGSNDKPAYLVKSEAGNFALKLVTELSEDDRKSKSNTPEMFKD